MMDEGALGCFGNGSKDSIELIDAYLGRSPLLIDRVKLKDNSGEFEIFKMK